MALFIERIVALLHCYLPLVFLKMSVLNDADMTNKVDWFFYGTYQSAESLKRSLINLSDFCKGFVISTLSVCFQIYSSLPQSDSIL